MLCYDVGQTHLKSQSRTMDHNDIIAELKSLPAACTDCSSHCPPHGVRPETQSTVSLLSVTPHCSVSFRHRGSLQKHGTVGLEHLHTAKPVNTT